MSIQNAPSQFVPVMCCQEIFPKNKNGDRWSHPYPTHIP